LHQEAYTQTATENLVLEKEPILDIPKEAIPIIVAAPIAKEVLDLDNVAERRTIRIQSENAKLFAEQKAGLTDESAPSANFIDKIAEVEDRMEPSPSLDLTTEEPSVNEEPVQPSKSLIDEIMEDDLSEPSIEAEPVTDRSKLITYIEKPEPKKSRSVIDQLVEKKVIQHGEPTDEILDEVNMEDEMESIPNTSAEVGETPPSISYDEPKVKEIIFEITNENTEEESVDEYVFDDSNSEIDEDGDEAPTEEESDNQEDDRPEPIPKTYFKDWKEKFLPDPSEDPPTEISIEEILRTEDENVIEAVIKEEVEEEKKKKGKKKKKKQKNKDSSKKKDKKKKKKKKKVIDIAKKSIQKNDDIISETLAELLVQQGSRKKAIQMYERLSLIFPEKSTFFADKILKICYLLLLH